MIPILYESTYLSIQTLWVFVVIALLISSYLAVERLRRARLSFTLLIEHSTFFLIWGIIGARLTYFVLHTDAYMPWFDGRTVKNLFSLWDQGFSFWGGAVAISLALYYQLRRSGETLNEWADALVVPLYIGLIIGDVGAFLGGYSYGKPTSLPWGVLYETITVKYTVPVHPTQIYSIIVLVFILWTKKKISQKSSFFERSGNTSLYLFGALGLSSFFLEFFRGDDTLLILGVRLPQILFLLLFLACAWALRNRYKQHFHGPSESIKS